MIPILPKRIRNIVRKYDFFRKEALSWKVRTESKGFPVSQMKKKKSLAMSFGISYTYIALLKWPRSSVG